MSDVTISSGIDNSDAIRGLQELKAATDSTLSSIQQSVAKAAEYNSKRPLAVRNENGLTEAQQQQKDAFAKAREEKLAKEREERLSVQAEKEQARKDKIAQNVKLREEQRANSLQAYLDKLSARVAINAEERALYHAQKNIASEEKRSQKESQEFDRIAKRQEREREKQDRLSKQKAQRDISQRGQGLLQLGYAIQDAEAAGMRGVMNNIPGILMSTNMSMAAVGAASIGSVAAQIAIDNLLKAWDAAMDKKLLKLDVSAFNVINIDSAFKTAREEAEKLMPVMERMANFTQMMEKSFGKQKNDLQRQQIINSRLREEEEARAGLRASKRGFALSGAGLSSEDKGAIELSSMQDALNQAKQQENQRILDLKKTIDLEAKQNERRQSSLEAARKAQDLAQQEIDATKNKIEELNKLSVGYAKNINRVEAGFNNLPPKNFSVGNPLTPATSASLGAVSQFNERQQADAIKHGLLINQQNVEQEAKMLAESLVGQIAWLNTQTKRISDETSPKNESDKQLAALQKEYEILNRTAALKIQTAEFDYKAQLRNYRNKLMEPYISKMTPLTVAGLVSELASLGLAGSISGKVGQVLTTYETRSLALLQEISRGVNRQIAAYGL